MNDGETLDYDALREKRKTERPDIDRGIGSGASSWVDEQYEDAPTAHDGRAKTRTGFNPNDADDPHKWKRLNKLQEGVGDSERKARNRTADHRRWINMFTTRLECTTHQQRRVHHVIGDIEMDHMAHYSAEKVILGTISLVADADASRHGTPMRDREDFRTLLTSVDSDLKELRSIRKLVRNTSDVL